MNGSADLHGVHPYPCKFPAHVAEEHVGANQVVLDPFCGSGTTLLVAAQHGNHVIGFDCNPIAILISQLKLIEADDDFLRNARDLVAEGSARARQWVGSTVDLHPFEGRDYWFDPQVRSELSSIRSWVDGIADAATQLWLRASLSAIVNRVSYQDSETRYARVARSIESGQTSRLFLARAEATMRALEARGPLKALSTKTAVADVGGGIDLPDSSVDLIITSPPYANTMDYYLYHKQRMNVLGFDYRAAQMAELGSRREYSSLKHDADKWAADYRFVISELRRVIRPDGRIVLLIGDSQIAGALVDMAELTEGVAASVGLTASRLASVRLSQRSRAFNPRFQRPNKREHTIVLRRVPTTLSPGAAPSASHDQPFPAGIVSA